MNYDINGEIILQKKMSPFIYAYTLFITIFVLSLILISVIFKYQTYNKTVAEVIYENNHYYIIIYLPKNDVKNIASNNILYIDKKEYNYDIVKIESEYFEDNTNNYQKITLDIDLPSKYQINNLNLNIKLLKENKKIINYILNNK